LNGVLYCSKSYIIEQRRQKRRENEGRGMVNANNARHSNKIFAKRCKQYYKIANNLI
jgi:hypothetical protein